MQKSFKTHTFPLNIVKIKVLDLFYFIYHGQCYKQKGERYRIGGGIDAFKLFQVHLRNYKITFYKDTTGENIVFEDTTTTSNKYLIYGITTITMT